jgi:hypothetical protein
LGREIPTRTQSLQGEEKIPMLSSIFGRRSKSRKNRSSQHQLAALQHELHQRGTELYIPFLEKQIDELQARIEQKGSSGG